MTPPIWKMMLANEPPTPANSRGNAWMMDVLGCIVCLASHRLGWKGWTYFIPTKTIIAPAVPITCPGNKNLQYLSPGPPSLNAKSKLPAKQSADATGCTYLGLIISCGTACVNPPTKRAVIPMGRSLTAAIIAESWSVSWKNVASRSWAQAIHMNTADAWKMSGKMLGKLQISCGSSEYPRGM